jgi:hypothetical protein
MSRRSVRGRIVGRWVGSGQATIELEDGRVVDATSSTARTNGIGPGDEVIVELEGDIAVDWHEVERDHPPPGLS